MHVPAPILWLAAAVVGVIMALQLWRRSRREKISAQKLQESVAARRHLPQSLHPVIDTDICIGSLSCLKACPEGDILGVIDGAARLVQGDHCIGHGRCAAECPVGAIKLVFGTAERGVDLPEIDEFFESSRAGVHVVGELGGMGLIKNALRQGMQVASRLDQTLPPSQDDRVDVAIVGAGPAGLATAAVLREKKRSFRVLEQSTLGGTVAHYPRQKVVMTETVELPFLGKFGKSLIAKEELLGSLERLVSKAGIQIDEGTKVTGLTGADGDFVLESDRGPVRARKVVLACGRRGSPRKLGVPGEELAKVAYRLTDPEQYDGCKVLVVGGGDSALESAIQLAKESSADVTLVYRGEAFSKVRDRNRQELEELRTQKRVRVSMSTQPKEIRADAVVLSRADGKVATLPNDFVIVQAGGDAPVEFLGRMGVRMKRYHGEERTAHRDAEKPRSRAGLAKERDEEVSARRAAILYAGAGLILLAWLWSVGWEYYTLTRLERVHSHSPFRPSGTFGHGIGIVATLFMMSNFFYPVRKRSKRLTGLGSIKGWLDFHTFVGFMSPLVIAFHAAFQSNNLLATATAAALLVVVCTGLIGRFIYGLVPTQAGRALDEAELRAQVARLDARARPLLEDARDKAALERLLSHAEEPLRGGGIVSLALRLPRLPFEGALLRLRLWRAKRLFATPEDAEDFAAALLKLSRLRVQLAFLAGLKTLLRSWRLFHASLAGFLVIAIAAHIGVSLYLGYGWKR